MSNHNQTSEATREGKPVDDGGSALQIQADARLIAAAPELLEQLKFIADAYKKVMLEKGYLESTLLTGRYGRAMEAIAKATGRIES